MTDRISCSTCKFARPDCTGNDVCHRYPPNKDGDFPRVRGWDSWCGEYVKDESKER